MGEPLLRPLGLLAELTHRCPLGCPYCSNPIALESRADEIDTATWARVFVEAVLISEHLNLKGGNLASITKRFRICALRPGWQAA